MQKCPRTQSIAVLSDSFLIGRSVLFPLPKAEPTNSGVLLLNQQQIQQYPENHHSASGYEIDMVVAFNGSEDGTKKPDSGESQV